MARIRSVWPDFFRDPKILALPYEARWLFQGIWTESDDKGRMPCSTRQLVGLFFPQDKKVTERKVEAWIRRLEHDGLLMLYVVDGVRYSFVKNWAKYQKPNKPQPAKYPEPPPDTLFETHSWNGSGSHSGSSSGTSSQGHSPQEGKGREGSNPKDPEEIANEDESVTNVPPPDTATDPEISHLPTRDREAVNALVEEGNTLVGAVETVKAIGADAALAKVGRSM